MSFKVEIEITPHGAIYCGDCYLLSLSGCSCLAFDCGIEAGEDDEEREPLRCPACLAAEKAWRERNEVLCRAPGETDDSFKARAMDWTKERNP